MIFLRDRGVTVTRREPRTESNHEPNSSSPSLSLFPQVQRAITNENRTGSDREKSRCGEPPARSRFRSCYPNVALKAVSQSEE